MSQQTIDCVFIFDTTGSMSPCIHQVRRNVKETCAYLYDKIPNLRIGILSHGDWCDGNRVISSLEFTSVRDHGKLESWINNNPDTYGGDAAECYEYAIHRARTDFDWNADIRFGVMIGDADPHTKRDYDGGKYTSYGYKFSGENPHWKEQLKLFNNEVGPMFPIQALGHRWATSTFWKQIADCQDNIPKLDLQQFSDIHQILMAVCMQQAGKLEEFENAIVSGPKKASYNVISIIDSLAGREKRKKKTTSHSKHAVSPSRFQVMTVDTDVSIKDFVENNHLRFQTGRGFYEFTNRVIIQDYKEVIIRDNETGDMFSGDKAREILGIPVGETCKVGPSPSGKYTGFIQSTSNNRKLLGGTEFLYEVSETD